MHSLHTKIHCKSNILSFVFCIQLVTGSQYWPLIQKICAIIAIHHQYRWEGAVSNCNWGRPLDKPHGYRFNSEQAEWRCCSRVQGERCPDQIQIDGEHGNWVARKMGDRKSYRQHAWYHEWMVRVGNWRRDGWKRRGKHQVLLHCSAASSKNSQLGDSLKLADWDVAFGFLRSRKATRAYSFADEIPVFKHKEERMTPRP